MSSDVSQFLHTLWSEGDVREVRIPRHNRYGHTASGYFDSPEAVESAIKGWDGKANVYITLNPVSPDLMARSSNRMVERAEATSADVDVVRRDWLFVDVDPVRPAGISSNEMELRDAEALVDKIVERLTDDGWPQPLVTMSGNGYNILYRIDLPNDAESLALVRGVLLGLDARFSTEEVKVDTSVSNAARIIGIAGMTKMKGDDTLERPHRRSRVVSTFSPSVVVRKDQLEEVAAPVPAGGKLATVLRIGGVEFREKALDANGILWYHVKDCPFHPGEGSPYGCGVGEAADGRFVGKCFHNRGAGKGWQEWKVALGLGEAPAPTEYIAGRFRYFVRDNVYWVEDMEYTPKGSEDPMPMFKPLSNFVFEDARVVRIEEERWLDATVVIEGRERVRRSIRIPAANFRSKMPELGGGMWLGGDSELAAVLNWVQRGAEKFKGVDIVGRHGNMFVLRDAVYTVDGPVPDSSIVYLHRRGTAPRVSFTESGPDNRKAIGEGLLALNRPEVIWPMLGWFFGSLYAPLIRAAVGHFPILAVTGSPGAGKTQAAQLIQRFLLGALESPRSASTNFSILSELSGTNAFPVVYDEVRRGHRGSDFLLQNIKEIYAGSMATRGTRDQKLNEYPLIAPICILGETDSRGSEQALSERIIPVHMPPSHQRTLTEQAAYYALRDMEAGTFAYSYMLHTLRTDFPALWAEASTLIAESETDREIDNIRAVYAGALSFINFTGVGDNNNALDSIASLYHGEESGEARQVGRLKPPLWTWLEQLAVLAQMGKLMATVDYTVEGDTLRIVRGSAWKVYSREYERDPDRVNASSHTIGSWLKEDPGDIIQGQDNILFRRPNKSQARGFAVSLEAATEHGIELEGFVNDG